MPYVVLGVLIDGLGNDEAIQAPLSKEESMTTNYQGGLLVIFRQKVGNERPLAFIEGTRRKPSATAASLVGTFYAIVVNYGDWRLQGCGYCCRNVFLSPRFHPHNTARSTTGLHCTGYTMLKHFLNTAYAVLRKSHRLYICYIYFSTCTSN